MIIRLTGSRERLRSILCVLGVVAAFALAGCKSPAAQNSQNPDAKKYALNGTVISVNADAKTASIDTEEIPGYMMPMTMDYEIHDAAALAKLKPKDKITADLIVDPNGSYIENVKVAGQASSAPSSPN
ncbi:MAG: copper-binding protein [Candidatus Acidiferrales bacterium]